MRLETRYGKERLEDACRRAVFFSLHSYRGVKNILEVGLDRVRPERDAGPTIRRRRAGGLSTKR